MTENPSPLLLEPRWPAPAGVCALLTTRQGGCSEGPYRSLNTATHVGDLASAVSANRRALIESGGLPAAPQWLDQVHGTEVVELGARAEQAGLIEADGSYTRQRGQVCVVQTADCLPVLLCDRAGTQVAALHAGWRGLAAGILAEGVARFLAGSELLAYLGPAIGREHFEVGPEVRQAFLDRAADDQHRQQLALCFPPSVNGGRFYGDLYGLARIALARAGVKHIYGGDFCTFAQEDLFFSYRRDGVTGRMASLIWLEE